MTRAAVASKPFMTSRLSSRAVSGLVLMMAAVCALLLALPGQTVVTKYLNDLFIFLDGAHRIAWGQVPHRDFHTALGPLAFYVPAAGYWLSGSFGAALPLGMALILLALAPILAHVASSRLHPAIALLFSALVILVLAVPINLGENIGALTFAMFYNRIGWAALAILLVMYLRPEPARPRQQLLDALCAAALTLVMIYTKVTYGLVALAFLAFMLLDPRQRRWAGLAIGLVLAAGLLVEAVWRGSMAYAEALALAGRVSGGREIEDLARVFVSHLSAIVLFAIPATLALWRSRSLRDALFFGLCLGSGLLIMMQNAQPWGIISLYAGATVAAEMLLRAEAGQPHPPPAMPRSPSLASGAPFLLLALLAPSLLHFTLALCLHNAAALGRAGQPFGLPNFGGLRFTELWLPGDGGFSAGYLSSMREGANVVSELPGEPIRVLVLDFASPLSAGLDLPPPRGASSWLHWGRNVDAENFIPPEILLADVEILMKPKWGINGAPLAKLYGSYIAAQFQPVRQTDYWTVYRRRNSRPEDRPSR